MDNQKGKNEYQDLIKLDVEEQGKYEALIKSDIAEQKESEGQTSSATIVVEKSDSNDNNAILNTEQKKPDENYIYKWVKFKSKKVRFIALFLLIIFSILGISIGVYFCWYKWWNPVFNWGFEPPTWKGILAVFALIYLAFGPFLVLILTGESISSIFGLYAEDAEIEFKNRIKQIERQQLTYEDKLRETDNEGLIPLVTYSRLELETYYRIGLNQTQKSFTYSIVSMWIGFFIIIIGIMLYIMPVPFLNPIFLSDNNLKLITIASGIVTEIISALFLWVYKNSINQITYFYNRQISIHNALFAFRIAQTMNTSDDTKNMIIERILNTEGRVSRPSFINNKTKSEP